MDHGGEFTSVEFMEYYIDRGMAHHLTTPYLPQQNRIVERQNMAWSMMKAKQMLAGQGDVHDDAHPQLLVDEEPEKHRLSKARHGRKPDFSFFRTFGCVSHVKATKPTPVQAGGQEHEQWCS
jgi:transposase InsO family protein